MSCRTINALVSRHAYNLNKYVFLIWGLAAKGYTIHESDLKLTLSLSITYPYFRSWLVYHNKMLNCILTPCLLQHMYCLPWSYCLLHVEYDLWPPSSADMYSGEQYYWLQTLLEDTVMWTNTDSRLHHDYTFMNEELHNKVHLGSRWKIIFVPSIQILLSGVSIQSEEPRELLLN